MDLIKEKINNFNLTKAFKIALAAVLSILTADLLGLKYAVTAGLITVLSIQNTKRETLRTARNRGLAFLCALIIAFCVFSSLDFQLQHLLCIYFCSPVFALPQDGAKRLRWILFLFRIFWQSKAFI